MVRALKDRVITGIMLSVILVALILVTSWGATVENRTIPVQSTELIRRDACSCPLDYNLPIIIIDTLGVDPPINLDYVTHTIDDIDYQLHEKSGKIPAVFKLYEPEQYGYTCICGAAKPTVESDILINIRGQSSLLNPKKQYTLSFLDQKDKENPIELLGMAAHDKWVLNGSYLDRTMLRNDLAYKMAGQIMRYAPRTQFCEVYINTTRETALSFEKSYIGVYLLVEKVERGKGRIDIKKGDERVKNVSFIIARDKIKSSDLVLDTDWGRLEDDYTIDRQGNKRFRTVITNIYPGADKMTERYRNRVLDYLNEFEHTLYSRYFMNKKKGYRRYIDADSFAKYAMVNEVFKNIDGGDVSTYFYKDISGTMKAGPVWDFDLSLGNTHVSEVDEPTGFRIVNALWFNRLFQDPIFSARYEILYRRYRAEMWSDRNINKMIDDAIDQLGPALGRNEKKWYSKDTASYSDELDKMRSFLSQRLDWMDRNIQMVGRTLESTMD